MIEGIVRAQSEASRRSGKAQTGLLIISPASDERTVALKEMQAAPPGV